MPAKDGSSKQEKDGSKKEKKEKAAAPTEAAKPTEVFFLPLFHLDKRYSDGESPAFEGLPSSNTLNFFNPLNLLKKKVIKVHHFKRRVTNTWSRPLLICF